MNKKQIYKFQVYNTEDGYLIANSKYLNINIKLTNKTFKMNKRYYKIKNLPKKYKDLYEYILLQIKLLNLEVPYYLEAYQGNHNFSYCSYFSYRNLYKKEQNIFYPICVFRYKYKRDIKILNLEKEISKLKVNYKNIKKFNSSIDIINDFFYINDLSKYICNSYKHRKEED